MIMMMFFLSLTDWSAIWSGQSEEGRVIHVPQGKSPLILWVLLLSCLLSFFLDFSLASANSVKFYCIDPHRSSIFYQLQMLLSHQQFYFT